MNNLLVETNKVLAPADRTPPDTTLASCPARGRDAAKAEYAASMAYLAKRPAWQALLKEYYVQWMSAIDSGVPTGGELKLAFQQRHGEAVRRAEEAWNRFAIEAGY